MIQDSINYKRLNDHLATFSTWIQENKQNLDESLENNTVSIADLTEKHQLLTANQVHLDALHQQALGIDKHWTGEEIDELRKKNDQEVKELIETILGPKLERVSEQFPVFRNFPISEIWRLCIDGRCQVSESIPFGAFEDEPSFLAGTLRGFSAMLDGLGKEDLTADYIEFLHDRCIVGTFRNVCDSGKKTIFQLGYRTEADGNEGFSWLDPDEWHGEKRLNWSDKGFKDLCRKYRCRQNGEEVDPYYGSDGHPVGNICIAHPNFQMNNGGRHRVEVLTQKQCRGIGARIIGRFKEEMEKSKQCDNEEQKLDAIERLLQDYDQCHLFSDGNIRALVFIVLPKILVENGLSPTILYDPNIFDGTDPDEEIKPAIRQGQQAFNNYKVRSDGGE